MTLELWLEVIYTLGVGDLINGTLGGFGVHLELGVVMGTD